MAKQRLSMRKIKEVLRLSFQCGLSARQVALSTNISRSTVKDYLREAVGVRGKPLVSGFRIDYLFHSGDCCGASPGQLSGPIGCPTDIRPHDISARACSCSSVSQILITEALVLERFSTDRCEPPNRRDRP